ncbi:cation-translocating P-type ATPase [Haploplasma axanthum]|uniref:Calcium-transporting ATPase lmo0841 n=1 Tax=Haploplasma axanthum TaxID=29552 RepID=A0A449BEA1_HAPAX|nr:cation-translocating P-type ATPase [Haploplasma axanthum]VEU80783.1 Calcium-transporting ATPase lmo0841 [Haploplasma axanthum]
MKKELDIKKSDENSSEKNVDSSFDKVLYQSSIKEISVKVGANLDKGLTTDEAKIRLESNGANKLDDVKKRHIILKFIDQLKDFMIIILFIAAIISIATEDYAEGILIIAIVVLNAVLGVLQEAKAEKALESIQALSSPQIIVIRDGKEQRVDVKELVIGDLVLLEAGDYVPADLRIIESVNLKIDESALTGEAVPVEKIHEPIKKDNVPLGDRTNLAFMSTVVTYGRGTAVVVKTGMDTEIGKIAKLLAETETEATPLQKSINQLGKTLAIIALIITGIIFAIEIVESLIINGKVTPDSILESFTFAVALAVAAIPEGLPAIITVVLSLGMTNLVKQNAIMRTLPSVETLGSTSIICSDKTGTLTQNVMTIQKLYVDGKMVNADESLKLDTNTTKVIEYGVLVNDVKVRLEDKTIVKFGDPTEIALIDLGIKYNIDPIKTNSKFKRIYELPFDSTRKLMTTVNVIDGKTYAIVKGAPDVVFGRSTSFVENTNIQKFDKKAHENFMTANNNMADNALRVLAIGYKELKNNDDYSKYSFEDIESDLTLLGLVGMIDPERPEVAEAVKVCKQAGITTVMITGDHKNTAVAIAKKIGILGNNDLAITGHELDQMNDEEFLKKLEQIRVYARVSPENKVRIVRAWRSLDKIVAMTGDGVNDAPSIKQADIGIAMGITGTEVAKGAADMILTDDNFATIVNAVGEGRGIFANIKKAIHFLLSCNIGEIVSMFLGVVLGYFLFTTIDGDHATKALHILTPVQILWVNLVTDSLMAIALGLEHREPDIMLSAPRDPNKSIFADGLGKKIAFQGLMIGLLTFAAFIIGWYWGGMPDNYTEASRDASTMAFMVLALSQLFHAFNARSERHSNFKLKVNKKLFYAFLASFSLQMIVVLTPATRKLFEVSFPTLGQWGVILALSIAPLVIVETIKLISHKIQKN